MSLQPLQTPIQTPTPTVLPVTVSLNGNPGITENSIRYEGRTLDEAIQKYRSYHDYTKAPNNITTKQRNTWAIKNAERRKFKQKQNEEAKKRGLFGSTSPEYLIARGEKQRLKKEAIKIVNEQTKIRTEKRRKIQNARKACGWTRKWGMLGSYNTPPANATSPCRANNLPNLKD